MNLFRRGARAIADRLGRDSALVRRARPMYSVLLEWTTRGRGLPLEINGITFRVDPRHRYLESGTYEPAVAAWLAERVRPDQLVLDVGANIGVLVLQFAHWTRPSGRVIAVEPNPAARAVLERHLHMNGLDSRVEVVPVAVDEKAGEAHLYAFDTEGMSRLGAPNPLLDELTTTIPVPVTTLDALCEERGIVPDWIYLDVEGFEIAALLGARRLLGSRERRPEIVFEVHPDSWQVAGTSRETAEALFRDFALAPEPLSGQSDPLGQYGHVWLRPLRTA